ncbi:uncharacterized protein Z520_07959 [Fonsecaea multimorphosa CBS 102226]|uniref:Peptidase M20 dimerisation domain-containing protein n=1 Tax=Fonsecaea multimorphosa CBS 102226 TaxID=1442371 RepID=A0A0D2IGK3_9EURO|nr:uncharacterized protein Z520_07959 [Fonsecaea multimorphosa CBS 102226]KIX96181.1 hypothetical protein Z520_07959 [Fonsecaea multimorphosa CBS 102226]OAL22241.1 hypothetical protein AYO22_07285 [Fonsecaea multimorphosa]
MAASRPTPMMLYRLSHTPGPQRGHGSLLSIVRTFATSRSLRLRTTELDGPKLSGLKVNSARLWDTIHTTAQWTSATKPKTDDIRTAGLSRLALGDEDKCARDWFISTTQSLGCKTHVDQMGNIFAIRPGLSSSRSLDAPTTFAGSHLDSQPSGGRFDGVLGVAAGIEMLRVLNDNWIETEGDVGVVNWTNEEGARFPVSMMGSSVWSGRIGLEKAWGVHSVSSPGLPQATVRDELERIGYLGDVPCYHDGKPGTPLGAHFELHIEQGPKLERAGQKIGIVQGVQAYKWFTVTITGRESHAGTTDFANRADALYFAATFLHKIRKIAESLRGLATVGMMNVSPGSVNTVPGQVVMSLDLRNPLDRGLERMVKKVEEFIQLVNEGDHTTDSDDAKGRTGRNNKRPSTAAPSERVSRLKDNPLTKIRIEMKEDFSSSAITFNHEAIKCIEESALAVLGGDASKLQTMLSGAGHDSVCTNVHCPTGMIFVPCKDGVSHNPSEWCDEEDCAVGANVLLHSVLRMDRLRKERGDFD